MMFGVVAQVKNHVEFLKVIVTMMMNALVIWHVEQTIATPYFLHQYTLAMDHSSILTAAMTLSQVDK